MDFLISPLGWKNWLLFIAALINLGMAIFIFSRGIKNKVNLYFSLLTFFCFLWGLSVLFARAMFIEQWYFWSLFAYPASIGIALSLFYFTLFFLYRVKFFHIFFHIFLVLFGLFFSALIFVPKFFIIGSSKSIVLTEYVLYHNKLSYIVFSIFFIVLVLFSLYFLYVKYKNTDSLFRQYIFWLFCTILVGLIFGTYFDLILCYFGNFEFVWLGPIFTVLMNFVAFYLLIFSKEK